MHTNSAKGHSAPARTTAALAEENALGRSPRTFKEAAIQLGYGTGFANAMEEMMRCEGTGHAKNEGDGAGLTFCGLTQKHNLIGYNAQQCDAMSIRDVLDHYRKSYWSNIGLDHFQGVAPAIAFRCFDAHVNSGGGGLAHMLTWVCDRLHIPAGRRSEEKMEAIAAAIKGGKISEDAVHRECNSARMWWYRVQCSSKWPRYGRGWTNRMQNVAERVGIIRGLKADTYFNDFVDSSVTNGRNTTTAGTRLATLFGMFTNAIKGVLAPADPTAPVGQPQGKAGYLESENKGTDFGANGSKTFTQIFGEPKEVYNPQGKPAKVDSSKEEKTAVKDKGEEKRAAASGKPAGLEGVLTRVASDTARARQEAAQKGKDERPWWAAKAS